MSEHEVPLTVDPAITALHAEVADCARDFLGDTALDGPLHVLHDRAQRLTLSLGHLVAEVEDYDGEPEAPTGFTGWSSQPAVPSHPPAP